MLIAAAEQPQRDGRTRDRGDAGGLVAVGGGIRGDHSAGGEHRIHPRWREEGTVLAEARSHEFPGLHGVGRLARRDGERHETVRQLSVVGDGRRCA